MSVISLAIMAEDDPNGSPLATITDADVEGFEMRTAENELGSGLITLRRDHSAVAYLVGGNYVKVTIPVIQADPIFGFWINEADDTILATTEEGAEVLRRGGPGTLAALGRALLLNEFYSTAPVHLDPFAVPGYWTWGGHLTEEPYGAILTRLIEEGQAEPGEPLADVTIDFDRMLDSNGDPWPNVTETIQVEIGTDGLGLYERLVATGNLFVYPDPDLLIHAYGTAPGINRTSATFATNKIRFEKGVNIETELLRTDEGRPATHALVRGKDLIYRQVVAPSYTTGRAKWITLDFGESNDPDLLDAVGLQELARQQLISDSLEFAIPPGDSWTEGRYLPFKHFALGDLATVHTGSGAADFDELDTRIVGIRISLRDASNDDTDEDEALSLDVVIEANGGPTYGGLGRRDFSVATTNGCAPCPGDFPWTPNGGEHYYAVTFSGTFGNPGKAAASSSLVDPNSGWNSLASDDTDGALFEQGREYRYHWEVRGLRGDEGSPAFRLDDPAAPGDNSADNNIFRVEPSGPPFAFTIDGTYVFNANMTMDDIAAATFTCTSSFGDHTLTIYCWFDPIDWEGAAIVPPSVGQWLPPATSAMVPDGIETEDTTPFAYALGSLHVEMNGSTLQGDGVDFTETSPTTGVYTFTRPPLADAQIRYWYQRGTT